MQKEYKLAFNKWFELADGLTKQEYLSLGRVSITDRRPIIGRVTNQADRRTKDYERVLNCVLQSTTGADVTANFSIYFHIR